MEKSYIEIDADPWLTCDGDIEINVYFGEACEPNYISKVSLKELVDRELESYTIGVIPGDGDTKSGSIAEYHKEDVKRLLESLRELYYYAGNCARELGCDRE